jgi:release factor glutamine methyltransferase
MISDACPAALVELLSAVADTGYAFVPPTPETHRRVNARAGNEQAHSLRDVFGWSRPFRPQILPPRMNVLLGQSDALASDGVLLRSRLRIATLGRRQFLHSAFPTVEHDAVFFGPDTYRFVSAGLERIPKRTFNRAVDLGCGSGAAGISIADERYIGELWLTDINPRALNLTRANARHAERGAMVVESNLFAALGGLFDLILANPPYLADPGMRAYRDGGGPLGMDLGLRIVRESIERLSKNGMLYLYTGVPIIEGKDAFRLAVERMVQPQWFDLDYSEIDPDVFGEELDTAAYRHTDRIAVIALTVTRRKS